MRNGQRGAAINQDTCLHCFCKEDTGGGLYCCKCSKRLNVGIVTVYPFHRIFFPATTYFTPTVFPSIYPPIQQEVA